MSQKTVAFFWERRSGFRLLKKRKYDEYMTHAVAVAPYSSVMVDGWLHLSPGTWVSMPLSEQSQPSLSQIRGISWAKDECYLHVRSYPLSYSYTRALRNQGPGVNAPFLSVSSAAVRAHAPFLIFVSSPAERANASFLIFRPLFPRDGGKYM